MKDVEQMYEKLRQTNLKKLLAGKYVPASLAEFTDMLIWVDELNDKEVRAEAKKQLKKIDIENIQEPKRNFFFKHKKKIKVDDVLEDGDDLSK